MGISDSRGNSLVGDSRNIGKSSRDITISIVDGLDNRSRGNLSGENLVNSVGFSLGLSFPLAIIMHRRTMGTGNWFIGSIHTGSRLGSIHKRSMDTSSICGWSMSIRESSMGISDSRGNSIVGDSRNIGKSSRDITISIVDGLDNRSRGNLSGENLLNSVGFSLGLSFPLAIIMHRRTMGTGNWFIGSIHTGSRLGSVHRRSMDTSRIGERVDSS